VTPEASASGRNFVLHFARWEPPRGKRGVGSWVEISMVVPLSVADASLGTISGVGRVPERGDWKMWVTWDAEDGYVGGQSPESLFSAR
jgi:hypothetical protein